jgi:hypothetical protein
MKKCEDIKNSLPLYLDNSLSGGDKKAVEEHLKACPQCTKELTLLSKAQTLVNNLDTVDPPPWFKQKIMARVREEAEKKSPVQKLFYPLRIKLPVQIFATICIAVLAVYIYRSGEERAKEIVPSYAPAPVIETQKSQMPEEKDNTLADKAIRQEDKFMQKKGAEKETVKEASVYPAKDTAEQISSEVRGDKFESAPAATSVVLPQAAMEQKNKSAVSGASLRTANAPQKQDSVMKPNLLLKVSDVDTAAGEVEKLLFKYAAKNLTRQTLQDKIIITAELKNKNINDLITELKTIDLLEQGNISTHHVEGETFIVIEIANH